MTTQNFSLKTKTLQLLQNRNVQLTLKQISKDTKITESWLSMFGQGKIENPSVDIIQALYEYLSDKKLVV